MIRSQYVFVGITALASIGLGYAFRARASGIPTANALTYAGVLSDANGQINGMHNIQIFVYDAAMNGNELCHSTSASTSITNGQFAVQLPDTCTAAVGGNANAWIHVLVDGSDTGPSKIGAIPYAVEASHAVNATNVTGPQAQQVVPTGAVMFFNLAACPTGWSALASAQGRYIVGLDPSGALASTVGTALSDQENRSVGQHTHAITDPGHTHGITDPGHAHPPVTASAGAWHYWYWNSATCSGQTVNMQGVAAGVCGGPADATGSAQTGVTIQGAATGISASTAGAVAGTNAPYVQLLACQKN
jgi:hypothetical protein